MGCTFRARLNHLCSIWYTFIVVALQAYLLYLGFERYRLYNEIKWPTGGYPQVWLNVYVIVYAACIPCTLLVFAFGFFKSGNIAGDNERLADREERVLEVSRNRNGDKTGCVHRLKAIWQHLPPLPQQLHVIMALAQLVAQQLMISQLYRHGFVNSGDFLNTEMDFLYQRARQLATNLPIGESRLQGFRITADELAGLPVSPNLLPLLMHLKLFGIPLEFVNLLIALVAFAITYPSVFWRVSKPFSVIFTLHLLIYLVQVIWGYLSFSILFRIQETNIHSMRPIGLGQYLGPIKPLNIPIYHPLLILAFFLIRIIATTLSPIAMYAYGYNKYFINVINVQNRNIQRQAASMSQSEYGQYRQRQHPRSPEGEICCDGYLPHMNAITLLVIVAAAVGPTIYALLILYQHEEKPVLLSCIIIDVVYLFTWILVWLGLTLKREWDFNVTHKVHHFYALQKGLASGAIRGNENPSQLKNSVLVVHRDQMFVTDDQNAKQSLLRSINTGKYDNAPTEDVYWKHTQASPSVRKITAEDAAKNSPEMTRLIRRPSDDNSQSLAYHTANRQAQLHGSGHLINSQLVTRGNSSPPEAHNSAFGTMQRSQQPYMGMGTLPRNQQGPMQRSLHQPNWQAITPQESYASIHKSKEQPLYQRSNENTYGQIENNYGSYGTYARVPQSRVQVPPQSNSVRINGSQYGGLQQSTLQRRSEAPVQQMTSVRQSPLLSERSSVTGAPASSLINGQREQSPYQRSVVKLSSFNSNDGKPNGIYGSTPSQWGGAQRAPPGQPAQLLWGQNVHNKSSTGSSQPEEQCFTPTSTLTSQGSNYTPTPGSPQATTPLYARINTSNSSGLYGVVPEESYADRTLQKPNPIKQTTVVTGNTTVRHAVKVNGRNEDSANFSLGSTNGPDSARQPSNEFATSIV